MKNAETYRDALEQLEDYHQARPQMDMRAAFANDPKRFDRYSIQFDDLLFDVSKCAIDDKIVEQLLRLTEAAGLDERRRAMFGGETINETEGRPVLHVALRADASETYLVDGENVVPNVQKVLDAAGQFARRIREGAHKGATGKAITDVVNIGIGGSDLGPAMVTAALKPYHDGPALHFVSNVDGADLADTLETLRPETTLFIVASKTFTTVETMTNANSARRWIVHALGEDAAADHFCAVSTALDKVAAFGIAEERVFGFWDWVGGRYSVWSAIGLPVMIAIGPDRFADFLAGARAMDHHFVGEPHRSNMPVMLALMGFWHRVICGYQARAVIPYDQRLSRLPAYLQQLDMESNGKSVTRNGRPMLMETGPIVFGEPGTNGQHAFFQLLHQGSDVVPVEFILSARSHESGMGEHHELLLANGLAQSEALMHGRTFDEALKQGREKGLTEEQAHALAPHRVFSGDRPSVTLLHEKLMPFALGRLIALYEHRVFVEGVLYGINSFDQWGVELGKELATNLLPVLQGKAEAEGLDSSTTGMIAAIRTMRGAG